MIEEKAVKKFLATLSSKYPNFLKHSAIIRQACNLAIQAHAGQKRKYSGGPFIEHPLSVALLCAQHFDDIDLLVAGILHDCVEDNEHIPSSTIYELFGPKVGYIVDSVTDTLDHFFYQPERVFDDKIEKILYGGMYDIRCLLLKLYDRQHNIDTLGGLELHKQIRMSFETQAIYEPLKKLFRCSNGMSTTISACETTLHNYLGVNHITTAEQFKEILLDQTFLDFDTDTFDIVYKNTNRIYWELDNKNVFEKLIETKNFDEKIEVISLQQDAHGKFLVIFKYKTGNIFEGLDGKLKLHTNFS